MDLLLAQVQRTVPGTGLKQFWQSKPCTDHTMPTTNEELAMLWNYVVFSHQTFSTIAQEKFFLPSVVDCLEFLQ